MAFDPAWHDVPSFPNYQVSDTGLVRNKTRGKFLSLNMDRGGMYQRVTLWRDNRCYGFFVHRLVAESFIPNPQGKPQVNHIDGNKLNNAVENLEWVTQAENNRHAVNVLNRPSATGERHGMTTLTTVQVREIREKYKSGRYLQRELASEYRVNRVTITNIVNHKTWSKSDDI